MDKDYETMLEAMQLEARCQDWLVKRKASDSTNQVLIFVASPREDLPVEEEVVNGIFGDSEGDGDSGDDGEPPCGYDGDGGPSIGPRARNTTCAKPRGMRRGGSRIEQLSAEVILYAAEAAHPYRSATRMEVHIKLAVRPALPR